jgi:hypothetical protein
LAFSMAARRNSNPESRMRYKAGRMARQTNKRRIRRMELELLCRAFRFDSRGWDAFSTDEVGRRENLLDQTARGTAIVIKQSADKRTPVRSIGLLFAPWRSNKAITMGADQPDRKPGNESTYHKNRIISDRNFGISVFRITRPSLPRHLSLLGCF